MEQFREGESTREEIKNKLRQNFDGKIVRKDLTKKIKEGANVPVYVLEFLLGQYCSSDDETVIEKGVQNVKRILADNFVRPDESQKILSQLRKKGSHTIIDMVTVRLDMKKDCFFAEFSNLGVGNVPIADEYPEKFDRLLCGGIWCIVQLDYEVDGDNNFGIEDIDGNPLRSKQKKQKDISPISIRKLTPIQMPHIDIDELKQGRKAFTKDEWLDILLRSIGMEPDEFTYREKWLLLTRMIPLVENNFNLCELGPRSTGKSHLYKEISPNSILISGGQTTVANLFYNMGRKTVGLVGLWDCVAFDEVAGIKFKDKDGIQIMKDYMASGSFARGKEEKAATASMVFVGNINQSVDVLLKTSSLYKGLLIFRFFLFGFLPFTFLISQCFIHSFNQAVTAVSRSGNCIYICILPADHLLENPVFRSLHIRLIICIIIQYKLRYLPIGNLYRNRHLASVALTGSCVNTILKVTFSIISCRFFH